MINHEYYMGLAIKLALRAKGKTSPNPLVGALVVKDGAIIGSGYHRKAGQDHAEVIALDRADGKTNGALLYVTLEPCQHFGNTPPCVDRIKRSGIREVIIATRDPNPVNYGKGILKLRESGIKVTEGVLKTEAQKINEVFNKYITANMPFVCVKIAQTLDGKIATSSGESKWITDIASRRFAHKLRSQHDAILAGINTILKDDPLLTLRYGLKANDKSLRHASYSRQPIKIILDSNLRTPPDAAIFSKTSQGQVIIASKKGAPLNKMRQLQNKGARILFSENLSSLMRQLAKLEISSVLIEGGGEVIASALKEKIVDKMYIFIAPKIFGGRDAPTSVEGDGVTCIDKAIRLKDVRYKRLGCDLLIEGYIK